LQLDNIHLSRFGHQVLAQAMFDWLVDGRLVPYRNVRPGAGIITAPEQHGGAAGSPVRSEP
jgi:hypothetical protein